MSEPASEASSAAVLHRLAAVREAIHKAEEAADRPDGSVQLVAVSKTFGADDIVPVLEAGQRVFGENRVQEAMGKWPGLRERFPGVELHLIGPLQTNKVREAVAHFDVIETLDRESLAIALATERAKRGKMARLLVQVNTGEEAAEGWSRAARCRCVPRRVPRPVGTAGRRADVHPTGGRAAVAAFRAARDDRAPQRPVPALDGHECRFRGRHPAWRDPCARGQRDLRAPLGGRPNRDIRPYRSGRARAR